MSQRLLFWTSLPPCYHQLFGQQAKEKKTEGENADHRYSNAAEIELDDEDEEKAIGIQAHPSQRLQRPIAPISLPDSEVRPVYQDVARGGYPAFSGSGLTDTERQVPTGFLERSKDGRIIKFISEKGEEVEKPVLPNDEGYRKEGKLAEKTRMGHSSGQKGKEQQSFNQKGSGDQLSPMNHSKRVPVFLLNSQKIQGGISARGMEDGESSKRAALSRTRSVENPRRQTLDKMQKLLVAENNTQSDSSDPERQSYLSSISGLSATEDVGPQFPLPPEGQALGKFCTQLALLPGSPALEEKSTVAMPLKKGVGSMRRLALPRSRSDKEMPHINTNRQNLKTNAQVDVEPPASAPPPSPTPSLPKALLAPKIPQCKRAMTLGSHLNLQQPLRSSFATVSRTNSARFAKSTRLARGVRFVDKVDEKSPSPPITEGTPITADSHDTNKDSKDDAGLKLENTRRSVRISRTNFHLPLPIIGTFKKEATRPESFTSSSTDSDSFDLKVGSEEPITRTQRGDSNRFAGDRSHNRRRSDEKADLPRLGRPKTMAFLDGDHLSGEREINSIRRPSSLGIDSRSSREMS